MHTSKELTHYQCMRLFIENPRWLAENYPEWIAKYIPAYMEKHRPKWMAEHYPSVGENN